jgi:UDP-N-acetylmuramoylalanine--D-glutamate ligase
MMTPVTTFSGRHVALFGLGGSGLATARALVAGGALVSAWDDSDAARGRASAENIKIENLADADWSRFDSLVVAPGVPLTHPEPHWTVLRAQKAGVEVIGDIELFCRERARRAPDAPFIAITGTNGKSTTTALIAHILRESGREVQMGGNIGTPILALDLPSMGRFHVIECSSFQIDLAPSIGPSVGVLINVTPDHLDRHGTMENYAAVKKRLIAGSKSAVIGIDDDYCRAILKARSTEGRPTLAISQKHPSVALVTYYEGGRLHRQLSPGDNSLDEHLVELAQVSTLRGAHNGQNAAAAFCACEWLGVPHDDIGRGIKSYPGLPHRMEEVARIGRVLFVNDSKATNADAAEKALLSFDDIYWIIGGKAKDGGIEPLRPLFSKIRKAYLIGAASDAFAATLGDAVAHDFCGTLDVAVERAARDAGASGTGEPVVLLSPACASYDQFANFEIRGDAFRQYARAFEARGRLT